MHPKALNVWLGFTYTLTCAFLHLETWGGTTSYHNSIIKALIGFDFQARNCRLSIVWRLNHSFNTRLSWTSTKNPKYIEPKPLWVHLLHCWAALRQKNRPKSSSCIEKMEIYTYIYMGSGRFPGPMELLLQQLVRVSKTRWRWFNLSKSVLLQPLIKKLEVLVMINQWTTYCINDNNDERWMVVLIDFYLTFCKN